MRMSIHELRRLARLDIWLAEGRRDLYTRQAFQHDQAVFAVASISKLKTRSWKSYSATRTRPLAGRLKNCLLSILFAGAASFSLPSISEHRTGQEE